VGTTILTGFDGHASTARAGPEVARTTQASSRALHRRNKRSISGLRNRNWKARKRRALDTPAAACLAAYHAMKRLEPDCFMGAR
jgi:hypothetical protein